MNLLPRYVNLPAHLSRHAWSRRFFSCTGGLAVTTVRNAIVDRHGRVMFTCSLCREPVTTDDFFELGLRLPDDGETQDDYYSAELLDDLSHASCTQVQRAG